MATRPRCAANLSQDSSSVPQSSSGRKRTAREKYNMSPGGLLASLGISCDGKPITPVELPSIAPHKTEFAIKVKENLPPPPK